MPRQSPSHRAERVFAATTRPGEFVTDDSDERSLHLFLTTGEAPAPYVEEAFAYFSSAETRHVLSALILAKASDDQIVSGLGFDLLALRAFRNLFFDRGVFRHDLDAIAYAKGLGQKAYEAHYKTAIEQGPDFLINRFRVGEKPDADPKRVLQSVLNDAADRFSAHRGQQLDSATAREAKAWGQMAMSAAVLVIDKNQDDRKSAMEEFRAIMLAVKDHTQTPEEAGINLEDVL